MSRLLLAALALALAVPAAAQEPTSQRVPTAEGEQALRQVVELDADLATVWALFTTGEGAARWMAPVAEVDLRTGGAIRTNYDPCATPGDAGTITNEIVNFVPGRMLTLRADLEPQREASWMNETIYAARDRLFAVVEFEAITAERTRITMWGLGYGTSPEWDVILGFFTAGNEWTFTQLQRAVSGEAVYEACEA